MLYLDELQLKISDPIMREEFYFLEKKQNFLE